MTLTALRKVQRAHQKTIASTELTLAVLAKTYTHVYAKGSPHPYKITDIAVYYRREPPVASGYKTIPELCIGCKDREGRLYSFRLDQVDRIECSPNT